MATLKLILYCTVVFGVMLLLIFSIIIGIVYAIRIIKKGSMKFGVNN